MTTLLRRPVAVTALLSLLLALVVVSPAGAGHDAASYGPSGAVVGTTVTSGSMLVTFLPFEPLVSGDKLRIHFPPDTTVAAPATTAYEIVQAGDGTNTGGAVTDPATAVLEGSRLVLTPASGSLSSNGLGQVTVTVTAAGQITHPTTASTGESVLIEILDSMGVSKGGFGVNGVTFVADAPAQLTALFQPGDAPAGSALSPQPVFRVRDQYGNPVVADPDLQTDETATIAFTDGTNTEGATLAGSTSVNIAWATASASFTDLAVDLVGSYQLTASPGTGLTGVTAVTTAAFSVTPAGSTATSTVDASSTSITADGSSTSTVTVTLRDADGTPLAGSGGTVVVGSDVGSVGATTDNGNGTYTATFTSPTTSGTATISATLGTASITDTAIVELTPGAASTATSTVDASSTSITADGSSTSTVTVTVLDANSNPVAGGTVSLVTTAGSITSPAVDNADGTYSATLTSSATAGDAVVTASIGTDQITDTATVTFGSGAADVTTSTLVVTPEAFVANGTATTSVVVTVNDVHGDPVPGYDLYVLPSESGTVAPATAVTASDGTATFTYSTTFVGEVVLYASPAGNDGSVELALATVTTTRPPSGGGDTGGTTTDTTTDGGTASTGTDATSSTTVQTSVTTPTGGTVTMTTTSATASDPVDGMQMLALEVDIDAPDGTVDQPLLLSFEVDVSLLTDTSTGRLTVVRNGVPAPRCTGPGATPDPCVAGVTVQDDGDVVIDVRTSRASVWNVSSVDTGCPVGLVSDLSFADVATGGVHADAIACAAWAGLVDGFDADTFMPSSQVTRGQAALVLVDLLEQAGVTLPAGEGRFTDVAGTVGVAAESLAAAGVLEGTSSTTFEPQATLTRGELAALLVAVHEFAGGHLPAGGGQPFDDVDGIFATEIAQAAELGLTRGFTATTYEPAGEVTRGEYASFVTRLLDLMVRLGMAEPTL